MAVTVISKCDQEVVGASDDWEILNLPNVGRCDHTYAHWISSQPFFDHENSEDEEQDDKTAVIFLKDTVSVENLHQAGDWQSFRKMLRTASSRGFSCGIEPSSIRVAERIQLLSMHHQWENLKNFHLDQ